MGYSYSGKVLAVRRVTENSGKKTPGVDREVWDTPEKEIQAVYELKQGLSSSAPSTRLYPEIGRQDYAPARKRGKRSVRRPGKEMQGAPKHAEFSDWRDEFYAAALIRGGERSWISAAVSRSMTFIGPPQSGQR